MKTATRVACILLLFLWVASVVSSSSAADHGIQGRRVNVNTASEAELVKLPGIGPAKARAIIEQREKSPFKSLHDLSLVSGIGDATLEGLRDQITVGVRR